MSYSEGKTPCLCSCTAIQQNFSISPFEKRGYSFTFFNKNLIRLGYGGGYFDKLRTDNNWRNVPCIGVLTSNCVSTSPLTRAEWDIPLSGFITEKEIFV